MVAVLIVADKAGSVVAGEVATQYGRVGRSVSLVPGCLPTDETTVDGNTALELKGQFDTALKHAEWAAEYVGPSARQYIFLAKELEERGDVDGALLRYRQAVAMEPGNPKAHVAFATFLLRAKDEPAAIHHLQAAYRLNPLDEWVVDQLTARSALPPLTSGDDKAP